MRIYVGAKWEEKDVARHIMDRLEKAGHTITYDWTLCDQANSLQALLDKQGVMTADAFVGIFERELKYQGAIAEFGIACAMEIPCYLIGHALDNCIFTKLPNVQYGILSLLEK